MVIDMDVNVFRKMSYGVYVVSTWDNGRATGCVANSAMQITSSPATIAVSINHDNFSNRCILETGKFALSILSEESDPSIIGTFGFQSGEKINKFEAVDYSIKENMPVLNDSCGYLICKVIDKMETATHTVFLGEVTGGEILQDKEPMTYAYYHRVVKGTSPKNAPTYIPEETDKDKDKEEKKLRRFKCDVCGYVYEGEELPEDYICPICGVGADKFTEI